MKNFRLALLSVLFFTFSTYGQWIQQVSGTGENLNDVYCVTSDIAFVVGDNGTILKTVDGGMHWVQKTSGTTYSLEKIQFVNPNVGYAIGVDPSLSFGTLLKTQDGGESWSTVLDFGTSDARDLSCVSGSIFYYASGGSLYKTIDGGGSFQIVTNTCIEQIQFISEQIGFASCGNSLSKTSDGGVTWTDIGCVDAGFRLSPFYFCNASVGFKKCMNGLYRTVDGGVSYTFLTTVNHTMLTLLAPTEDIIWGVSGALLLNGNPNFTTRGELISEGNFQRIDADSPLLKSVYFATPTIGYAVGWGGSLYKNTTGTMLSVPQFPGKNKVKIYPNPASGQITLAFSEPIPQDISVKIIDNLGKKVFDKTYIPSDSITIPTTTLSKGIYYISIINQEECQIQKLIIN